jgi:hypothetical protein
MDINDPKAKKVTVAILIFLLLVLILTIFAIVNRGSKNNNQGIMPVEPQKNQVQELNQIRENVIDSNISANKPPANNSAVPESQIKELNNSVQPANTAPTPVSATDQLKALNLLRTEN